MDAIHELENEVRNFNVLDGDPVVRALLLIARILLAMWNTREKP